MIDLPPTADPGDALSQPTRGRLFALLAELKRPVGTAELADRLGLHPNGVRLHLERLEQEELVERVRVRTQRGRPPDAWRSRAASGDDPVRSAPVGFIERRRRRIRADQTEEDDRPIWLFGPTP